MRHGSVGAHDELAHLSGRQLVVVLVDDPHLVSGRDVQRGRLPVGGDVGPDDSGVPISVLPNTVRICTPKRDLNSSTRGTTGAPLTNRSVLSRSSSRGGWSMQPVHHRGDERGGGAAELADVVPEVLGLERLPEHDLATREADPRERQHARHVEHRERAVVDVVAGEVDPRLVRPQPAPRHEHALRRARRARRVADARDVVALRHGEVGRGRRRVPQRLGRDEWDREVGREVVGAGVGHDHQLEPLELGRDLGDAVEVLARADHPLGTASW